ncbi:MAG TPA: flagellar basal body L-ring protein FlgH [Halanaerobiaceae bacterium]|jgi:flagellar L-ring protein precursor FlgH|nr:flagellar basal body L-ring protein FlgH [Bacillota bacterium]HHU92227.1 flagellar basal body L-ring protein FlgH [Halanaerobiaceae bacterium]HOA40614.1 flagellar basal body L-ring protein FlgH [Halanaerobiales bacterium]HPZ63089.1 flagellar basal body L-ring protein FlgH [Halanaerobiales bacterium]HQD03984.1 flagellar basal body L-ring protein FlgH [Halanaerobiales bacterium]
MRSRLLQILTISGILLLSFLSFASSSLWSDDFREVYKEKEREFKIGDIVTIIIEENTTAVSSANTSVSQGSSVNAGAGFGIFDFLRSFGFSYADDDGAQGQTQRAGSINADVTALVVDILDNGNLQIEGSKKIKVNGEEQVINLSGIVRQEDISKDNTVPSWKIANVSIDIEGEGIIAEKQRPNLFQRILNWIF